jgi:GT2 family glycosyltransferase
MKSPSIAIMILNWNSVKDSLNLFSQLTPQISKKCTIYILDNGSRVKDYNQLKNINNKQLKLYRSEINLGFTGGCNFLFQKAKKDKNDLFLFINNDTNLEPNLLEALSNAILIHGFDIVSPVIMRGDRTNVEHAGGYFDYITSRFRNIHKIPKTIKEVNYLAGCCIMLSPKIARGDTIFKENYFAYFEDAELSNYAKSKNFRLGVTPETKIYHTGSVSASKKSPFQTYLISRNRIKYVKDCLSLPYILYFLFLSTAKVLIAQVVFLKNKARRQAFTKGYLDGWSGKGGAPQI